MDLHDGRKRLLSSSRNIFEIGLIQSELLLSLRGGAASLTGFSAPHAHPTSFSVSIRPSEDGDEDDYDDDCHKPYLRLIRSTSCNQ